MADLVIKSKAKINLGLNIVSKRSEDFQSPISFHFKLTIKF
jgi:4-diphosphocytidyl-2C-methyl-D-erythritol kinase